MYTVGMPERPYAEIGIVRASSFNWTASTPSPLIALRDVAAAHGCDGVIVMGPRDRIVLSGEEESTSSGEARVASGAQIERDGNVERYEGYRTIVRGTCIAYY
jgi:hypothetical protein